MAGLLVFLTALLVVIYPIRSRAYPQHNMWLELADALASGIFLGAALFHMLPDAIGIFSLTPIGSHYPLAELWCAAGFLLLLFLERLSNYLANTQLISYMLTFILIIHALIEGAALGISTTLATTSILFLAIIAHKSSETFALAVILNRGTFRLGQIILLILLFSIMTPLGIFLGTTFDHHLLVNQGQLFTASFNAFAAGTFLYMSTLHHINHHKNRHHAENLWEFFALVVGLGLMATLAIYA